MKYRFVKWDSGTGRQWDRELVSYGNDTQCAHDGQETICEKFPMEMVHNSVMTDRKLFAKGFLWKWYTIVS